MKIGLKYFIRLILEFQLSQWNKCSLQEGVMVFMVSFVPVMTAHEEVYCLEAHRNCLNLRADLY